ncbi:MAG: biotin--[acetyl-CoA-carboxylase] ligase, partial [Thermanaeromonas sp.]|uniref:biotin--[acetyl-CoA-carboxylase] ligase n=1 Tax=Thermanaeromonas sp. TaxID=2003697 RepID=UPI00243FE1C7
MGESKQQILDELKKRKGEYISGEELSRRLGLSRTAIWKHVKALRRDGYCISASTRLGYALLSVPDRLYPEEVYAGLKTAWVGRNFYYYEQVGSTNQVAKELAEKGAPEGTAVVAEEQTSGRGRLGRGWLSPAGKGIWLSLILRPRVAPWQLPQLSLLAAVGVVSAITEVTGLKVGIKWPNDILSRNKKLCGILTEMRGEMEITQYVILGIGLNVNLDIEDFPEELRPCSTSLKLELGEEVPRLPLLNSLFYHLEKGYEQWEKEGFSSIREAWKKFSVTLGRMVRIEAGRTAFEGVAVDI